MNRRRCRSGQRRRDQLLFSDSCRFCEAIFILRLERAKNQLGQQFQAAHVAVIEAEGLCREGFQQSNHAPSSAERHRHHGTRTQLPASIEVYAVIGLRVIAADDLRRAETCSRKCRVALDPRAHIRLDRSRRRSQYNLIILRQGDT